MDDQLEAIFSTLFAEFKMQRRVVSELSPTLFGLAQALSHRYGIPVAEDGLIICVSSIHAVGISLVTSLSCDSVCDDKSVFASFSQYANAIVFAEDFRRKTGSFTPVPGCVINKNSL
jgi:hypothetical protein